MLKKRHAVFIIIALLTLILTACGEKCMIPGCDKKVYEEGYCEYHLAQICKADDCNDDVYKDGYCKYHYTVHDVDSAAKDLFDGLFGG